MDKAKAKEICSLFRPVLIKKNRVKCKYYKINGRCKRPRIHKCKLKQYQEAELLKKGEKLRDAGNGRSVGKYKGVEIHSPRRDRKLV